VISEIKIQNFKSIQDLRLKLGRVTVLIGENGSGKSNILEAIAFAGCAATDRLENEYLAPRGIRVTEDTWMISAFPQNKGELKNEQGIKFSVTGGSGDKVIDYSVTPIKRDEDKSFFKWRVDSPQIGDGDLVVDAMLNEHSEKSGRLRWEELRKRLIETTELGEADSGKKVDQVISAIAAYASFEEKKGKLAKLVTEIGLDRFVIFAPENTTLRLPSPESVIQPLGAKGEGLFSLLQSFTAEKLDERYQDRMRELQSHLQLFGWFDKFLPLDDSATNQARLQIHDRWLAPDKAVFDQRSANEGFLYVLFYFTLLMSWRTPIFFAIDNIDTALNPKLCSTLMEQIIELAKKYDKQVICTTHNPAILDGLDLKDNGQRLYTVSRDSDGHTKVRRVTAPEPQKPGDLPIRLSEAFQRGLIGGLPSNF
jgi:predicted ATPase